MSVGVRWGRGIRGKGGWRCYSNMIDEKYDVDHEIMIN
jgi:hypothetical protein